MMTTSFSESPRLGGTLVWYFTICKREVWLMARGVEPDRDDEFLALGRLMDKTTYNRDRHCIDFGNSKFDIMREEKGTLVVGEIKKSSRSIDAARLQLAHYLYELQKNGVEARGELLFPKEKKREEVLLSEELKTHLDQVYQEIIAISSLEAPPCAKKCKYCRNCAYNELCWS
ncbi:MULTISPECIES: CRISPR-associated protein Cas4 [Aminobacterium]|uniref:CRISPR-associated protein Cas4 n=2 Tax=Aminobacterium TaxID=81466 RepID=UPI00257CD004|nr:CRISPR-associated protein Cas4 [Aminobacterium sp. UBA4908]